MPSLISKQNKFLIVALLFFGSADALSSASLAQPGVATARSGDTVGAGKENTSEYFSSGADQSIPLELTLEEATWISLDISPDGETLVFDLLGDLYTLPVTGGNATRITSGTAYDVQPRYSPDGRHIAFVSDRNGSSNIWRVEPDGTNPQLLVGERHSSYSSPDWSADGNAIIVDRFGDFDSSRKADLFQYDLETGSATRLADRQVGPRGGVSSPDGRWIYYSREDEQFDVAIEGYDLNSGETVSLVKGYGGAVRPAVSPDGRWLAFGRRIDNRERLVLRDLVTGDEKELNILLDWDQRDNPGADGDLLPGYTFTPDSNAIIYSAHGKIRRYGLQTDTANIIPFRARFSQAIPRAMHFDKSVDDGPVRPRLLRWAHESPDRGSIFFNAVGKNYRYDFSDRSVSAVGDGATLEYAPAVSPDGRWLAYVSWSDEEGGHIYKTPVDRYQPIRLTDESGHYENPSWSEDGEKLVFLQSSGGERRGVANLVEHSFKRISWLRTNGEGTAQQVTLVSPRDDRRQSMRPQFRGDGRRIYFAETSVPRGPTYFCSVSLNGSDKRCHIEFEFADDIRLSPGGDWVAFTRQFEVYLTRMPDEGADLVAIGTSGNRQSVVKVSHGGGYFVNWAANGDWLTWSWGREYFRAPLKDLLQKTVKNAPENSREKTRIEFSEPRAQGEGWLVLQGARIITLSDRGVIEQGDILVENNRIQAVAKSGQVKWPADARVMDVTGKTIIPGLIDTHWHYKPGRNAEIFPGQDWGYVAQLAYGVTTVRDPSARSQGVFTQAEMIETGRMLGPRIYSTGEPIYFQETAFSEIPNSLADARLQVGRLQKLGATAVKQYVLPRREQRQWLLQAARERGMLAVAEGASKIYFDMTLIMDGYTTLEHAIKTAPLYRDMRSLLVAAGTYYVPTLIICPNGSAEDYFYQHDDVLADKKLLRFTPYNVLAAKARLRVFREDADFYFRKLAESAAAVHREGGKVVLGAHGDLQGLGAHWELWALEMGGLSPLEALHTATTNAADALGLKQQLGSLEVGKLADLVVLDDNPLADIRNSSSVRYVMKNGRLWDGETMDQIWPEQHEFQGFYWRSGDK